MRKTIKKHLQDNIFNGWTKRASHSANQSQIVKREFAANNIVTDNKGSILPLFGLLAIPLMVAAGFALDYSRMSNTRTKLATALDAALISAGTLVNNGERNEAKIRQKFDEFIAVNLQGKISNLDEINILDFNIDFATGEVSASISSKVDTTLMKLAKFDEVDVGTTAAVKVGSDPLEVAMALDVTGSMSGSKIEALKTAASNAIDIMIEDKNTSKTRISLVPYASAVNVGPSLALLASANKSNRCVVERDEQYRYNRDSYSKQPVKAYLGNDDYCPSVQIQPLTSNTNTLNKQISDMNAIGRTAGHLGVAWSYYTLSPEWNSAWPGNSTAAAFSDKSTTKIAILMTDGEFNTSYNDDRESSADIAIKTCSNMKADNIQIYSIMFSTGEAELDANALKLRDAARATMQNCASSNSNKATYYHEATNEEELIEVFRKIATSIKRFRLAK